MISLSRSYVHEMKSKETSISHIYVAKRNDKSTTKSSCISNSDSSQNIVQIYLLRILEPIDQ